MASAPRFTLTFVNVAMPAAPGALTQINRDVRPASHSEQG